MDWRTWRLYGLIIVGTLAGAELLARIYDWSPRRQNLARNLAPDDGLGMSRYRHSATGFGDLVPRQDGHWIIWFHRPYHVQTNRVGLRNTEEPSTTAFRILAIGDSQTFGPYLANEDTWPAWTENYLRQRDRTAERTQVFNAGIAGYTIADELAYLKERGVAFEPKLVVLAVFENDLHDLRKERNGLVQRPARVRTARIADWLAANSALADLADQIKTRWRFARANIDVRRGESNVASAAPPAPDEAVLAARYHALFDEAVGLLKAANIRLAVVFIPAADVIAENAVSAMEPVIRAATAAAGTPYLDLTPMFRTQPDAVARLYLMQRDPAGQWTGNRHLSREGNAVIGRTLAEWLVERKLTD